MASKRASSGGKAEATGANYETLVGAWYCVRLMMGSAAEPLFDLHAATTLTKVSCQTTAPVDDVNALTSEGGTIYVQAKRTVQLSDSETSALGKSIDQFVRQFKEAGSGLDLAKDRLVLATRSRGSSKIGTILPRLLRGLRDQTDLSLLSEVQTSEGEEEVARVVEDHVKRCWQAHFAAAPTDEEIGKLLRLVWVQTLDVEDGERDRLAATDALRTSVLAVPTQAAQSFAELIEICARLRADRSGVSMSSLQAMLVRRRIQLIALPDYRQDIAALKAWTAGRLAAAARYIQLLESKPASTIERAAWPALLSSAQVAPTLIVGEPGAGKSGLTYRLAKDLLAAGKDVVFIPVDLLNIDTFVRLQEELGISHSLADVLENWPGGGEAVLVIDALDAARKLETQTVLRETIADVIRRGETRWNVVASVRKYDLCQGLEWRRLFRGVAPDALHAANEFAGVRHIVVSPLSDDEVAQTTKFSTDLHQLFVQAAPELKALLRNAFNLHLLAELLELGVVSSDLAAIRNQSELLETYWQHRVRRSDGRHDVREATLTTVLQKMIGDKALRVFRHDVRGSVDAEALVDLEAQDILRAEEEERGSNEDVLLFSHHVLFDYAVARLIFRRARDSKSLIASLKADRALSLMLNPSLVLAMTDLWNAQQARTDFWRLALEIAGEGAALPQAAHLVAPMIAAESARTIDDLRPLLDAFGADASREAAEKLQQMLIGALLVRIKAGVDLVGDQAGPWVEFMGEISRLANDSVMFGLRPLLYHATEKATLLTAEQLPIIGSAARRLLEFAWSRNPRSTQLVIGGLSTVSATARSDVAETAALLRRAISQPHLSEHGYEELHWIARRIADLFAADPSLAIDIYQAAYGYVDDQSDTKTDMSKSQILSLTSNRRQDYQSSWHLLSEALPRLLAADPLEATRALARAIAGFVAREHPLAEGEANRTFEWNGTSATVVPDASYSWYRAGYRSPQDGPKLLTHYDSFLSGLDGADAPERLRAIASVLASEATPAVVWGSLLAVAVERPQLLAPVMLPLLKAGTITTMIELRHLSGRLIAEGYQHFAAEDRKAIEDAILEVDGAERAKQILAACIPEELVATDQMCLFRATVDKGTSANRPPIQFSSGSEPFDTDAYLASEGVPADEPTGAEIRDAMREVQAFAQEGEITVDSARSRLEVTNGLLAALENTPPESVHATLYEHACGVLASSVEKLGLASKAVVMSEELRPQIARALVFAARSTNPHFDQEVEDDFHESLGWGGPSARTDAAEGLMCLVRFDDTPDASLIGEIHRLARDPVCHVRLQIAQRLHLLHKIDPEWMWSELEHIIQEEPTRGVIAGALHAASNLGGVDISRVKGFALAALDRFRDQDGPGIEHTRELASTMLADIGINEGTDDAVAFVTTLISDLSANSDLVSQLVARYSPELLAGSPNDLNDQGHQRRARTLRFYSDVLKVAFDEIERATSEKTRGPFSEWPQAEQASLRNMFKIVDELTMRLYFSSGAREPDEGGPEEISPKHRRLYVEAQPMLRRLAEVTHVHIAHYLIQTLEAFIPIDPAGVFALIAQSVRSAEEGGYGFESMAADVVVRIVERYLADHREVFADPARLTDLMDCLDVFVRRGWPAAQSLTYRLGEIWR